MKANLPLHSTTDHVKQIRTFLIQLRSSTYSFTDSLSNNQPATMSRAPQSGSRKISFNVSEQYDIQDVVGEGAYGVVWYVTQSDMSMSS